MTMVDDAATADGNRPALEPGVILVNGLGNLRILRSRTRDDDGWNCADGAAIDDVDANDADKWRPYRPEQLAADLEIARELHSISGERELSGGLATWDACSGRRCVLPKLVRAIN